MTEQKNPAQKAKAFTGSKLFAIMYSRLRQTTHRERRKNMGLPMKKADGNFQYDYEVMTDGQLANLERSFEEKIAIFTPFGLAWQRASRTLAEVQEVIKQRAG